MSELISIIIVNWNGKKWLKDCLSSLENQTYKEFETIFVDNASKDDSVSFVQKEFPKVKIIQNKTNRGFAGGNNDGLALARGKYVLLLNNDTSCPKNYLDNFIKVFKEIPNAGCVQSKILLMDQKDKLDLVGSYWTDTTFLYYFGFGKKDDGKYEKEIPVFSCKGASMMIRREVIDKVGLFDDDFWNYYEETDFCHRVWLAGYECWYYPKAYVYHAMGGTSINIKNSLLQYHNFKNKLLSFLKNFEVKSLITIIPIYIAMNILISIIWLLQGKIKHSLAIYNSLWWNLVNLKLTFSKRRKVQAFRNRPDAQILKRTKVNPRLSYYFLQFGDLTKYED